MFGSFFFIPYKILSFRNKFERFKHMGQEHLKEDKKANMKLGLV